MSRISSMFFILALIVYYVPKFINKKNKVCLSLHKIFGVISAVAMSVMVVNRVGTEDFIKYLGFAAIIILICITGILIKKDRKTQLKAHGILTIGFFVYLFVGIII